ncbi:MAG: DUF1152 domain-containing protein [Solirubrobacterales bacterium]
MRGAQRVLVLGIGGGGDVVGALSLARRCEALGTPFALGGVAWERFVIDPHPGPRPVAEIAGGRALRGHAVLADARTTTPEGVPFSEAHVAGHLGAETVLIDVSGGAPGAAEGIEAAAAELGCDLAVYADVGGDALALGSEAGLASPLCDAVMLAAGLRLAPRLDGFVSVLGPGCDGELEVAEVLGRVAALARAGAWIDTWSMGPAIADDVERAAAASHTEASMLLVRCARGEVGEVEIRGGRRTVSLGPLGALAFSFDLERSARELPLARALREVNGIEAARDVLAGMGVRTELDYERSRAREGP